MSPPAVPTPRSSRQPDDGLAAMSPSLKALAARGVERVCAKGRVLINEGDVGDTIYIILRGKLRVFSEDEDGHQVTYGHYGPGEYMGELGLDGGPRSASVEAVEKSVVSMVTRVTLQHHLSEDPAFAFELMNKLINRVRMLTQRTRDLALNDAYGRLVNLLNRMAVAQPDGTRLTSEPMTQAQIAEYIGCGRTMVARLLTTLDDNGHLRREDRRYRILRPLPPKS